MSGTLGGYHGNTVTLAVGGAYASPLYITGTLGGLSVSSVWDVTLSGEIGGTEAAVGIAFAQGGRITNAENGVIRGGNYGVYAVGAVREPMVAPGYIAVSNAGYIGGARAVFGGAGVVSNASTGTISGQYFGVLGPGEVSNAGAIYASSGIGVGLSNGGESVNWPEGRIFGSYFGIYGGLDETCTVENAGTVTGGVVSGVKLSAGTVLNTGTVNGGETGIYFVHPGTVLNAGLVEGEDFGGSGVSLAQGGVLFNSGTIVGYTGIFLPGGTVTNDGLIEGEEPDSANGNGVGLIPGSPAVGIDFGAAGTLVEEAGGMVLGSVVAGGGTLVMAGGYLAEVSGFSADVFAGPATIATRLAGIGTISGFAPGDVLVLTDQSASYGVFTGGKLRLSNGEDVAFAGSYGAHGFAVTAEAGGGTEVTTACFCRGTRLKTDRGAVAVEELLVGDGVVTLHAGVKQVIWIGRRGYLAPFANHPDVLPVRIAAGALGHGMPVRDLCVSPGHGVWVMGMLVPAGRLVGLAGVTQAGRVSGVAYFHVELEGHEVIFAEGCPVESLVGFRGMFENGVEGEERAGLARLESGFLLEGILRRKEETVGRLVGCLDKAGPGVVSGWARDLAAPEVPVVLDLVAEGRRVGRVVANRYRADLRVAGMGNGCHGFEMVWDGGRVEVVRAFDGARLAWLAAA